MSSSFSRRESSDVHPEMILFNTDVLLDILRPVGPALNQIGDVTFVTPNSAPTTL